MTDPGDDQDGQHILNKKQQTCGYRNRSFTANADEDDLDRIEVISNSSSSSITICTESSYTACENNGRAMQLFHNQDGSASENFEMTQRCMPPNSQNCSTNFSQHESEHNTTTQTNRVRRWSQNMTRSSKDKNAMSDGTIYRLPSRRAFEVQGKMSANSNSREEIEQLVREIEQHGYLMADTALGEKNRLETLRALPHSLAVKRILKQRISLSVEEQTRAEHASKWQRYRTLLRNGFINVYFKFRHLLEILFNGIEIWYQPLKEIEGHFGSNVSSYFKFLRWLFMWNVLIFVCTCGFITIPQILYNNYAKHDTQPNADTQMPFNIVDFSQAEQDEVGDYSSEKAVVKEQVTGLHRPKWSMLDLLTGEGALKSSLLFCGSYSNATFSLGNSKRDYSLSHAYYMTMLMLYLFTLVVISISMARSYRKSFIQMASGVRSMHANKIFCSWDYSISTAKAAELKHLAIYTELKEVLNDIEKAKEKLPLIWRIWNFGSRLSAHLLICSTIAGVCVIIWILLKKAEESQNTSPAATLIVPLIVNLSILGLQALFSWVAKLEDYHSPKRSFRVAMIRNFILESTIIGVIIYYWLTKNKYRECWETAIGQDIYRLIITDFIIDLLLLPLIDIFRVIIANRFFPTLERPEFDISQKSLGLVYNQSLLWLGLFFAPLLGALMVVKMFITFYVKKALLQHLCKSPRHIWRSGQTQTLYLIFSFLSLLGVIIALGYIMTQIPVSKQCGPFRDYSFMFQIFIDGVLKLRQNPRIWHLLMMLIRPAVIGGILVVMTIMVYYLRAKSRAHCKMVKLLKEMLHMEIKDKEYLLAKIAQLSKDRAGNCDEANGRNCKSEREGLGNASGTDQCRRWRYLRHKQMSNNYAVSSNGTVKSGGDVGNILRIRNV